MTDLISNGGVCRKAPAAVGLFKMKIFNYVVDRVNIDDPGVSHFNIH